MRLRRRYIACLVAVLLCFSAPAARANLTPSPCGLPLQGYQPQDATFNLSADCLMTGSLEIANGATVTINGNSHAIKRATTYTNGTALAVNDGSTLTINDLTVNWEGNSSTALFVREAGSTLNLNRVTVEKARHGIDIGNESVLNLTSVLFADNYYFGQSGSGGRGTALTVDGGSAGASLTMTNTVFRNNRYDIAALRVRGDNASTTVTASGCLTFSGNLPYNKKIDSAVSFTDNSTGKCTGTIGNGGSAVTPVPQPAACGLPVSGTFDSSANYTLSANCASMGRWIVSENVTIKINGNGHTISDTTARAWYMENSMTSKITIENARVEKALFLVNFSNLTVKNSAFVNHTSRILYNLGQASFTNVLFQDNSHNGAAANASVILAFNWYLKGAVTITDGRFINNRGTNSDASNRSPVLNTYNLPPGANTGTITLNGCATFANNAPANYPTTALVTDNTSGACGNFDIRGPQTVAPSIGSASRAATGIAFQRLGGIGILYRIPNPVEPEIHVYGVAADSVGFFLLAVTQSMVDAVRPPQALVAASADGRVAVRVWADRNITFAMGPDYEGKIFHVTLQGDLNGPVIETITTYAAACPNARQDIFARPEFNDCYIAIHKSPPAPP